MCCATSARKSSKRVLPHLRHHRLEPDDDVRPGSPHLARATPGRPRASGSPSTPRHEPHEITTTPVAYAIDGADDLSVAAAARLLEQGVRVRAAEKAFEFDGARFDRGSVLVTTLDNRTFDGDLPGVVPGHRPSSGCNSTRSSPGWAKEISPIWAASISSFSNDPGSPSWRGAMSTPPITARSGS
jgi:hypothetical protein